ncbi:MAG TPA: hypothetical protein VK524_29640 [Polyangiaceae bacterium]|nr:hypothetical protein [Polyangiaceae bacterium]
MPNLSTTDLKKALLAEGFEIYRTLGTTVILADRVRDNLIMDSAVAVVCEDVLRARFTARAQRNDFPGESEEQLFQRAREQVSGALESGYREVQTTVVPIRDPSDGTRTLDTWYDVNFEKSVADVSELAVELRFALSLDKTASRA